jgi:hypothetical protein
MMKNFYLPQHQSLRGCVLALCFLAASTAAQAADFMYNGVAYNITSGNTCAVTYLDDGSYEGSYILPEKVSYNGQEYMVTAIGDSAFWDCGLMSSVVVPNSVITIGKGSFALCYTLSSVKLSEALTTIEEEAFLSCDSLRQIVLPNSLKSIGNETFAWSGLRFLEIPRSVEKIGHRIFYLCDDFQSVSVDPANSSYCSEDNLVLFTKNKDVILWTSPTMITYTMPNTVTSIDDCAFRNHEALQSVQFSQNLKTIGYEAFYGCTRLRSIVLPQTVTSIDTCAFGRCTSLNHIVLSNSLTTLETNLFVSCGSLQAIDIPESVSLIRDGAFAYCTQLDSMFVFCQIPPAFDYYTKSHLSVSDWPFYKVGSNIKFYVPEASIPLYKQAEIWSLCALDVLSTNRVMGIKFLQTDARPFALKGNVLELKTPGAVMRLDGSLVYSGTGKKALPSGCYIVRVGADTRKVWVK